MYDTRGKCRARLRGASGGTVRSARGRNAARKRRLVHVPCERPGAEFCKRLAREDGEAGRVRKQRDTQPANLRDAICSLQLCELALYGVYVGMIILVQALFFVTRRRFARVTRDNGITRRSEKLLVGTAEISVITYKSMEILRK